MSSAATYERVAGPVAPASLDAEIERDRLVMEIDLDAVAANARLAAEAVGGCGLIAVLKGDAYGLGIEAVTPSLRGVGIDRFATDNAAEAVRLREAGVADQVLVLYPELPDRVEVHLDYDLTPIVYDAEQASQCAAACASRGATLDVWIGANVGFNRAGGRTLQRFEELADHLAGLEGSLRVAGVLAHLTASHAGSPRNAAELEEFRARVTVARRRFGAGIEASLFASHGLIRWGETDEFGPGRPGLMLAGEHCFTPEVLAAEGRAAELAARLRPAVTIRARVINLIRTESAQTLGYAPGAAVASGRVLATVALGFRTGFPAAGESPPALCRGTFVRRLGSLGMDSLQIDVTDAGEVSVGDWVTFSGRDGDAAVGLDRVCAAAGVSPYQLLSGLRMPRVHLSSSVIKEENQR
jgi:alanine racemase